MATIDPTLAQAVQRHRAGDLRTAERLYRHILAHDAQHPDALHLLGLIAHQIGKYDAAARLIRQAISADPSAAPFHNNLGGVYQALGRLPEAVKCCQTAARLRPDFAEAHFNLGNAFKQQGQLREAASAYQRAVGIQPENAEAYNNWGTALRALGQTEEAIAAFRHALKLRPDYAEAHHNLGGAWLQTGKLTEAEAASRQALERKPDDFQAHYQLGRALHAQRRLDEAIAAYQRTLQLEPDHFEAHVQLGLAFTARGHVKRAHVAFQSALKLQPEDVGAHVCLANVLETQGRLDEAVTAYERALQLNPDYAPAHGNLGIALVQLGRIEQAIAAYKRSLELDPDSSETHVNLALALRSAGKLDEAVTANRRAVELKPDDARAHFNLASLLMTQGHLESGGEEYEWRRKIEDFPIRDFPKPLWDGQSLEGRTILVHAEQGLGDTLQFVRYLPMVKERGGTVIFGCQAPLSRLLQFQKFADRLVAEGDKIPAFDVHCPLLSLPHRFRTSLATIPDEVPYLSADPSLVASWKRELGAHSGFKVGICWQGRPTFPRDRFRSIPLHHFAALAQVPEVTLISLQKGPGTKQLRPFPVLDLDDRLDEHSGAFMDTAAIMENLDLVVTSDTAVSHLAGALGVPVWTALEFAANWRWLLGRPDSPWYPTMRLFRQSTPGDWEGVFQRIALALEDQVRSLRDTGPRPEEVAPTGQFVQRA